MDVVAPKLQLISRPPYGIYNVEGSLKNWASLRKLTTSWKQTEGLGSLTQLHEDALAEEKEDGQPYISDGSRDNEPKKKEHVEGPILVSDDSESEKEHRRRGHPQVERRENTEGPAPISDPEAESGDEYVPCRPLRGGPRRRPRGSRTLVNRGYHNAQRGGAPLNGHQRGKKSTRSARGVLGREEEKKLMSQPKQLVDTPCENCAKEEYQCYVENERIKDIGPRRLRCIRCTARKIVCGESLDKQREQLLQRLENP
ncbi:hypothetical protein EV421DRAFT_486927 [Armillaria borealis]|uniref:Uncharacterized protein n=1 Tax=Armillaria borealis TaxID=47425 RepID=A0AA39JJS3_9AGAR|nr:hypothetical protein EV421DRAFT_486927 [Armillaria borealis]